MIKDHPTDPDKVIYQSRHYDFPLQGVATPKREWVGLTDEQIDQLVVSELGLDADADIMHNFARAIEAKLKEKNT